MDLKIENKKRSQFKGILIRLANNQELLAKPAERQKIYRELECLYFSAGSCDKFRHFYSDIFSVLVEIQQDITKGSLEILGQNLYLIRSRYKPNSNKSENGEFIDISDCIKKLYDHVNLDISRIVYMDKEAWEKQGAQTVEIVEKSSNKIKALEEKLSKTEQLLDELRNKLVNSQKEYIAILGIFSAVVLAFIGEIAFTTSVFQNLHSSSIYRILIATILIGLVTANVIYGLFYYIHSIVRKQEETKLKPILIINIILLLLLALTVAAWFFGTVEWRNNRF